MHQGSQLALASLQLIVRPLALTHSNTYMYQALQLFCGEPGNEVLESGSEVGAKVHVYTRALGESGIEDT